MKDYSQVWLLDSDIVFLNHGSFGACPRAVLETQQRLREQLEREPVQFFVHELEPLLDAARSELATFVGATAEDVVFVPNATAGVNAVLRSLPLTADDELLTTNHEYNASRNALNFAAEQAGAEVVVADIPFPLCSSTQIIEAVLERVTSRTRLVLLDHVTSHTGLIFPIEQLAKELAARGIETLIDGAHAPGMLPLNLSQLGVTFYTGNCHKWLCAPKGAAFLYVQRDRQPQIRPIAISHGANSARTERSRFLLEFDWTGTADPTAYLCIPAAIQLLGSLLPGGWAELMQRNRSLVLQARQILCQALNIAEPCPDDLIGSLATIPLGDRAPENLQNLLFQKYRIEVPVNPWPTGPLIRISAQIYNTPSQYRYLAEALMELLSVKA